MLAAWTVVLGALVFTSVRAQDGVTVTFVANEGVMLAGGGKRVLIDALFSEYKDFPIAADSTQERVAQARAPFDSIDLILVTHQHGDHFHPAPVVSHLAANPRATLVTSGQVIDSLRSRVSAGSGLSRRLAVRPTTGGTFRRETVNGVQVDFLGVPHGGGARSRGLEHLGFIVELGGRRVLHLGDTGTEEEVYSILRLDTARVDIALVPAWMVTEPAGRRLIERWIRPKQVVAIHMGPGNSESSIQAVLPGAAALSRSLDVRRW